MLKILILTQLATALFMTGLIWLVQLVHYPLFAAVGEATYQSYHRQHVTKISWIVMPVMTLELVTAVLLWQADLGSEQALATWSLIALGMAWGSTALFSVPCHNQLSLAFDEQAHRRLVQSNWIRALAWTARSALLLALLASRLN